MSVTITFEQDEALVLFELLATSTLEKLVDTPERNALWAFKCLLERELIEPFLPDYSERLEKARQSLIARFGT